jgi:hypothetical protein
MIFLISYLRTYITPEGTRKVLGNKKGIIYKIKVWQQTTKPDELTVKERVNAAFENVKDIVGRVWVYVIYRR